MLLRYAKGGVRTRKIKNAQSKSWNIRYNRTKPVVTRFAMEHYMEQSKNNVVLDKHSLFCYAGDQHKPEVERAMALLQ